jgi:hypothetical protein
MKEERERERERESEEEEEEEKQGRKMGKAVKRRKELQWDDDKSAIKSRRCKTYPVTSVLLCTLLFTLCSRSREVARSLPARPRPAQPSPAQPSLAMCFSFLFLFFFLSFFVSFFLVLVYFFG